MANYSVVDVETIFFDLISATFQIYLGIFAGFLFVKIPKLAKYRPVLVKIIINFFTPVIILLAIINIEANSYWIYPVFGAIIVTALGVISPKILAKFTKKDTPSPAELCTSTFPNAVNFPFPIIFAFSGDSGIAIASLFLGVTVIMRNSLGFWISGYKITKESILQILKFPPNWGIMIGGLILMFSDPVTLDPITGHWFRDVFFEVGIFGTLMTVGFAMKKPSWEFKQPIFRVGFTRFIISGMVVLSILLLGTPPAYVAIAFIVQMMAPPAVYNGIYAERFGLDTELTSQVIVALTLIALVFLPIEIILIQIYYG